MNLLLEQYSLQLESWPSAGQHILAQFDEETIVVYQAFAPHIANEAVRLGRFGSSFSLSRMSWIKPNFLWMMYRSGWASKENQERVLAIRLRCSFFNQILAQAVASTHLACQFETTEEWKAALSISDVRLQWDPDHDPSGAPTSRRALQLGLRGRTLAEFASTAIVAIEDITEFVHVSAPEALPPFSSLATPRERVYLPAPETRRWLGVTWPCKTLQVS